MNENQIHNATNKDVKTYNRIKLFVSISETLLIFLFLFVLILTSLSKDISDISFQFANNVYIALIIFILFIFLIQSIISFPLSVYSNYYVEHKYALSNQTFFMWIWEEIKSTLISITLSVPLLLFMEYILRNDENNWWIWVGIIVLLFSVVIAKITPTFILPLFYKFKPIGDETIVERLNKLCSKEDILPKGIFSFNLSKETKKANAFFTGIGKSKSINISDTLLEKFSIDEIEVVFAHELGHNRYKHLWKGIIFNTVVLFLGLYIISVVYSDLVVYFGYSSISDIAAFPLIFLLLSVYGFIFLPITNFVSRHHEREADYYAVKLTNNYNSFESTMLKLANLNLSDKEPIRFVEIFFYSHPSISNRIKFVKERMHIND
jgi:STE24 endopeptidase